ncbi:peptide-binding protein [Streptomyces sp. AJS327]|uniref:ABC transporter substrate-binding protein n=1 Tax=Streptomyces sp. AJS327 TaxID=2545265 RepID=UPI0015DE3CA9|nr:ABC transporter substrate-binding protein [Streptomyces sp. AJS327]MBA0051087.1 peptide-binding protein [Streptomyces sp. AJS327]
MLDRNGRRRTGSIVLLISLLAGCSSLSGDSGEKDRSIVVGTTSVPSVLDPAAAWDGSWELYRNTFQTLLSLPGSTSAPEPDAARHCAFTDADSRVYRCTLRKGVTFSNGNTLDAAAVKHSIDRVRTIRASSGPAPLLDVLDRVEAPDARTVVFHLKKSDATFPFILATPATALVDPESYPADRLRTGRKLVGSGPYVLESYEAGKEAELVRNSEYTGPAELKNDSVTIRYFTGSAALVKALKGGTIDLTYRGLTPRQITDFREREAEGGADIDLTEVPATETRYLVFNPKDENAAKPAVRRAVARVIDRKALVRRVYDRTVDPLYSVVPSGITGHTSAFYDAYGEPSTAKAKKTLTEAGIDGKVSLTLWYTTDRYGEATRREFKELKRQLEASGLFDITVRGRPWSEFQKGYGKGDYPVFGRGWFGDFPDADNYVAPFVGKENALNTPYENQELTDELLPRSRRQSDRATASRAFKKMQKVMADDARLLPLWQGKTYIAADRDVAGVEWSLDPSVLMQMWELYKKSSW